MAAPLKQVRAAAGARQAAIDEWARNYRVAFREVADPDCGVDPDADGDRFRLEYWHSLTRAQQEERIAKVESFQAVEFAADRLSSVGEIQVIRKHRESQSGNRLITSIQFVRLK